MKTNKRLEKVVESVYTKMAKTDKSYLKEELKILKKRIKLLEKVLRDNEND